MGETERFAERLSAGDSAPAHESCAGGVSDPDLAAVAKAWPTLPAPIRAAVLAMVRASQGGPDADGGTP